MKTSVTIRKAKEAKDKQSPTQEIIEFTNPVEISGDGEYLYITEIETAPQPNSTKGLLQ